VCVGVTNAPLCRLDAAPGGRRRLIDPAKPAELLVDKRGLGRQAGFFNKLLEETAPQMAQKNINLKILRDLRIPVPPLTLQKGFAQRVKEIRELEASQAASRARLDALFQSMLHRAFNGEL